MDKLSRFFDWLMRIIRRFASWWWSVFHKQSIIGKLIFASVSLCIVCFLCSLPSVILSPSSTPTSQPISESNPTSEPTQASATDPPIPTDTPVPTDTSTPMPEPTSTPKPTNTPHPTNTSIPALNLEEIPGAIQVVSSNLGANQLGITSDDLVSLENPKGEGIFVYVEQTEFSGVERYIIWLVLNETAYPLNGATKDVTPSLPWPREAQAGEWEKTELDPYSATEAIEIVFNTPSEQSPVGEMSALEQMEIAFEGGYTKEQIKERLDRAIELYGLPITEENYQRAGSLLVVLREENGVMEMDILA